MRFLEWRYSKILEQKMVREAIEQVSDFCKEHGSVEEQERMLEIFSRYNKNFYKFVDGIASTEGFHAENKDIICDLQTFLVCLKEKHTNLFVS